MAAVHFEFGGTKINTIILFFSVNNEKNLIPVIEGSAVIHHLRNVLHRLSWPLVGVRHNYFRLTLKNS